MDSKGLKVFDLNKGEQGVSHFTDFECYPAEPGGHLMSAFNILICEQRCANCGQAVEARLQFKYGDTWQLEYRIGDRLSWGGNAIGRPNMRSVVLNAAADNCPQCKYDISEDFEIFLEDDTIVAARQATGLYDFSIQGASFIVIKE